MLRSLAIFTLSLLTFAGPALAQLAPDKPPPELEGIQFNPQMGGQVPLEATFTDDNGKTVRLGDFVNGERPVILQLGYFECTMMCDQVSKGLVEAVRQNGLSLGQEFDVVMISIDDKETWQQAQLKKKSMLSDLGGEAKIHGVHMLVGQRPQIDRVANQVGFVYRYIPALDEYSHPSGVVVLSPSGKITRYLFGVNYDPQTFRLSLVEASAGTIGTLGDQIILWCLHYDRIDQKYVKNSVMLMRLGGAVTLFVVVIGLAVLFIRGSKGERRTHIPATLTAGR
jgi:protein SCO1